MSIVLQGSTSGSVTLQEPAVAGTTTINLPASGGTAMVSPQALTIPNTTGTVMVSGNMPAFSAYQSSNQSISNTTFTKVTLDVEEFDTNNNFASNRFTPTVAGYYQINGFVLFSTGTATNSAFCNLFKNGVDYKRGVQASFNTANNIGCCVSTLVYFNGSTDYVELYVYQNNGSSNSTIGGASLTYFNGSMVRSA